jgi:hypothetical protein
MHNISKVRDSNPDHHKKNLRHQSDPLSPSLFLIVAESLDVMVNALVSADLFSSYKVGRYDTVNISHLQIADDTLLVCTKSWTNIRSLKAPLLLFEVTSGLKDYFHKSMFVGVNVSDS